MRINDDHNENKGILFVLLAALCFSIGGLLVKMIPWSFLAINGARNLIGASVIGIFLLASHHKIVISRAVLIGAASTIGVTTFFILANKMTTAANAIVLQYTAPVFVIIFMALFFKVKPEKRDIVTCISVFAGVCIFFIDGLRTGNIAGDLIAILAGVFYSGVLMMNTAKDSDALSSCFLGQLTAGILFSPLCLRETDFSPSVILFVLVLGVVQVGLAYVFLSIGIRHTRPVAASFVLSLEPILNPLWVALFYGETISPLACVGAAVVILSVLRYNMRTGKESGDVLPENEK